MPLFEKVNRPSGIENIKGGTVLKKRRVSVEGVTPSQREDLIREAEENDRFLSQLARKHKEALIAKAEREGDLSPQRAKEMRIADSIAQKGGGIYRKAKRAYRPPVYRGKPAPIKAEMERREKWLDSLTK